MALGDKASMSERLSEAVFRWFTLAQAIKNTNPFFPLNANTLGWN
jgi:hypothetical protein